MTSPNSWSCRLSRSSGGVRSTTSRYSHSSSSPNSDASTIASRSKNPVANAARSVRGVFVACFAPSETENSKKFRDSDDFKAASVASVSSRGSSSNRSIYSNSHNSVHGREAGSVRFTMEEILKATRNFSPSLKIGQGGFGTIYKGRLQDGNVVAIKRAKKGMHENHLGVEFQSEIWTLAQVEHLNLVKFYGYIEHDDEKILITEYVPNGTLREHLDCINGTVLDLAARLDIATDVAHAVTYLHMYTDHPIIHRDIKASNVLLTQNLRAKVTDFGFARLGVDTDSGATHVFTQVKGTAGYLDPEYVKTYQLTEKSDVYSFGVLLIELVSGRRPIETKRELKERVTAKWAMKKYTEGDAISVLDPKLERTPANNLTIEKILELALLKCLAPNRHGRPSMRRCAEILWSIRKDYRDLSASDFHSLSINSHQSTSTRSEQGNG